MEYYRIRSWLCALALSVAMSAALPVHSEQKLQEITVTGSRLTRTEAQGNSPISRLEAQALQFRGLVRLEDALRAMPQLFVRQGSGLSNGATGTATVDLRNLGTARTLVLLNGRRMPAGSPLQNGIGADLNQIPGALVDKVEVLSGGASAAYGSDALAGVVNAQLLDDFEGVRVNYQFGRYQHDNDSSRWRSVVSAAGHQVATGTKNDGTATELSWIAGRNLAGGRGNITAWAGYRDIHAVLHSERDYSSCALSNDLSFCYGSFTIPQGRFANFGVGGPTFDYLVQGDQFVPSRGTVFNYAPYNYLQRPDERYTYGALGRYEFSDRVEAYTELLFMDNRSVAQIAPSGAFFVTDTLRCDNAFLSAQQFEALCGAFGLSRDDSQTVYLGRRNVEGGNRQQRLQHESMRGVLGLRGAFNEHWRYDAYLQYDKVDMRNAYLNDLSITRIGRALDAVRDDTGNIVCRAVLDGTDLDCVPWNVFRSGGVNQAMIDYLTLKLTAQGDTEQFIASGYFSGDLAGSGLRAPLAVDAVSLVAGLEYREQNLEFDPDEGFRSGDGAGQGGATRPVSGGYRVFDVFLEGKLPLIQGAPLAEDLNLELAYRYSDFDYDVTTHTFAVRGSWALNRQFRFRSGVQRAVRAPNVRELFLPPGFNLFDMSVDPCAGPLQDGMTAAGRTFEECARSGVTAAQFGNIPNSPAGQYNFLQGGNAGLVPERGRTWSAGLVLTPDLVNGLTLSLDYYSIRIAQGIAALTPEFVLNQCLDGNLSQCASVRRGRSGDLWLGSDLSRSGHIVALQSNLATERVKGLDAIVDYGLGLGGYGRLSLRNVTAYMVSWEQQELASAPVDKCVGKWGATCGYPRPAWKNNLSLTWTMPWDVSVNLGWRYLSGVTDLNDAQIDLRSVNYIDLAASWEASAHLVLRAGVNNLFDAAPPVAGAGAGPSIEGNGVIFPGLYDTLGRYWSAGLSLAF